MRCPVAFGLIAYLLVSSSHLGIGQELESAENLNPNRIAIERWYEANESEAVFSVGRTPHHMVFDGEHL